METDPVLRRVERTSLVVCGVMAAAALGVMRGRPEAAFGVIGGWVLAAVGYRAIVAGVDAMVVAIGGPGMRPDAGAKRRQVVAAAVKMSGRYALLAVLAYVMIARLRLHPLGLLAGASSAVAAVSIEAIRLLTKKA